MTEAEGAGGGTYREFADTQPQGSIRSVFPTATGLVVAISLVERGGGAPLERLVTVMVDASTCVLSRLSQ